MKKLIVAIVIVIVAGVASSWAVTNTFHVTQFRGTPVAADGTKTPITATQISTNRTIMVVSDDAHDVVISEISGTTTNVLMTENLAAFTAGGNSTLIWRGSSLLLMSLSLTSLEICSSPARSVPRKALPRRSVRQ